jgi:hypothetical protein
VLFRLQLLAITLADAVKKPLRFPRDRTRPVEVPYVIDDAQTNID